MASANQLIQAALAQESSFLSVSDLTDFETVAGIFKQGPDAEGIVVMCVLLWCPGIGFRAPFSVSLHVSIFQPSPAALERVPSVVTASNTFERSVDEAESGVRTALDFVNAEFLKLSGVCARVCVRVCVVQRTVCLPYHRHAQAAHARARCSRCTH